MNPLMGLFIRLLFCILFAGIMLYKAIDKRNELTELRLSIPLLAREVKEIQEKNLEYHYAIKQFESPVHLIEKSRQPEFGHLKHLSVDQILLLPEKTVESVKRTSSYGED